MGNGADVYTKAEAARICNVTVTTINRWARDGKLDFTESNGGSLKLVTGASLRKLVKAQGNKS